MTIRKVASTPDTQLTQIEKFLPMIGVSMSELLKEEPIGIEEAKKILGIGKDKIVEYIKNEALPHDMVAGRYQFYKSLILAWRVMRHLSPGGKH